jgi:hypothetical protein
MSARTVPLFAQDRYDGLAAHIVELTSDSTHINALANDESRCTVLGSLRELRGTDDPEALDAALQALIRHAQAARKILKAGAS